MREAYGSPRALDWLESAVSIDEHNFRCVSTIDLGYASTTTVGIVAFGIQQLVLEHLCVRLLIDISRSRVPFMRVKIYTQQRISLP